MGALSTDANHPTVYGTFRVWEQGNYYHVRNSKTGHELPFWKGDYSLSLEYDTVTIDNRRTKDFPADLVLNVNGFGGSYTRGQSDNFKYLAIPDPEDTSSLNDSDDTRKPSRNDRHTNLRPERYPRSEGWGEN